MHKDFKPVIWVRILLSFNFSNVWIYQIYFEIHIDEPWYEIFHESSHTVKYVSIISCIHQHNKKCVAQPRPLGNIETALAQPWVLVQAYFKMYSHSRLAYHCCLNMSFTAKGSRNIQEAFLPKPSPAGLICLVFTHHIISCSGSSGYIVTEILHLPTMKVEDKALCTVPLSINQLFPSRSRDEYLSKLELATLLPLSGTAGILDALFFFFKSMCKYMNM